MDQSEFIRRAEACLERVSKWLEDFDPDELDYTSADGALTIEFPDGARFILSRQAAASQLWLAAAAEGLHFNYNQAGDTWIDDKEGRELLAALAHLLSEKLGRPIEL